MGRSLEFVGQPTQPISELQVQSETLTQKIRWRANEEDPGPHKCTQVQNILTHKIHKIAQGTGDVAKLVKYLTSMG